MKDSRNISQNDRKKILNTIEKSPHEKIILTHGTYTMPDTAKYLKAHLKRKNQTIILTGSMIPIEGFSPSDGPFNLGFSIAEINNLPHGIYVCMNGTIFTPDEVIKILKEGRFASIFSN
jgi:L-asparaginase